MKKAYKAPRSVAVEINEMLPIADSGEKIFRIDNTINADVKADVLSNERASGGDFDWDFEF